jgi:hypothetical protein
MVSPPTTSEAENHAAALGTQKVNTLNRPVQCRVRKLNEKQFLIKIKQKYITIVGVQSRNKCSLGNVERKEWAGLFV